MSAAEVFLETPTHLLKTTSAFDRPQKRPLATTLHDAFPAPPLVTGRPRSSPRRFAGRLPGYRTRLAPTGSAPGFPGLLTLNPPQNHQNPPARQHSSNSFATQNAQVFNNSQAVSHQVVNRFSTSYQHVARQQTTRFPHSTPAKVRSGGAAWGILRTHFTETALPAFCVPAFCMSCLARLLGLDCCRATRNRPPAAEHCQPVRPCHSRSAITAVSGPSPPL
jgi:hypothetical protein